MIDFLNENRVKKKGRLFRALRRAITICVVYCTALILGRCNNRSSI